MNYKEQVICAFNDWAKTYEEEAEQKLKNRGYSYKILTELILKYMDKKECYQILELGVGTGLIGKYMKKKLSEVEIDGIDISLEMIKKARQKNVYKQLYLDGADNYKYNKTYQFVYTAFMLHSVEHQKQLIEKIYDKLYKNGVFVIVDLIPNLKPKRSLSELNKHSKEYEHGAPANYKYLGEYIDLIEHTQFNILEIKQLGISKDYNHYMIVLKK